jgi:vancomycin permeability regulator SanA
MLMIITQEFHNTRWWVGSAYQQDNIPFPENDITGEIYELTIE